MFWWFDIVVLIIGYVIKLGVIVEKVLVNLLFVIFFFENNFLMKS